VQKNLNGEIGFMQLRKNNGNQRSIGLSSVIYGNHIIFYYISRMTRLDHLNIPGILILYLFHGKLFTFYFTLSSFFTNKNVGFDFYIYEVLIANNFMIINY
jgi:hypothetical protein